MNYIKKIFKINRSNKIVWIIVISAIILNLIGTRWELSGYELRDHPNIGILLSPFDNIRYGHYVARKFFLVVIAFLIFGYWLKQRKQLIQYIKTNWKYLTIIGIILFTSRILTYGFWFYNDDTRFFSWELAALSQSNYNPQAVWGPIGLHPIAMLLLVIRWFGTNYTLYNTLGLFLFFLVGIVIFILTDKIQDNEKVVSKFASKKVISLITAIFFLTTPTYFQGRLLIGEVINSPFVLILVLMSFYLLLRNFIPGALIFAAAALEYGVAKTYIIALPLTLFIISFIDFRTNSIITINRKKSFIFFIFAIFLLSLIYKSAFGQAPAANSVGTLFTFDKLMIYGDVLMSVTLPYGLSYPLVKILNHGLDKWTYITVLLGFLTVLSFTTLGVIAYLKRNIFTAKLIVIGLSIILPCSAVGSLLGVRVERNVQKLVEDYINSQTPTGATGYGFFPAFGLVFILIGFGYFFKKQLFMVVAILLILLNITTSLYFDYNWLQSPYAYPQHRYNEQLKKIFPRDNNTKYVYVPSKQRPLYQGIVTFIDIFQGDKQYYLFMDVEEFIAALKKDSPPSDNIYFVITTGKPEYILFDYSNKIRQIPYEEMSSVLKSLTDKLTPNPTYF